MTIDDVICALFLHDTKGKKSKICLIDDFFLLYLQTL